MADIEERKIPLDKIKSKDEYEHHKSNYEYCRAELVWLATTKNPAEEVAQKLRESLKKLDEVERKSKREQAILKDIHILQVKLGMLQDGSYETVLNENLIAEAEMLSEFELNSSLDSKGRIKELFKGNENARKLLDYDELRLYGMMTKPPALDYNSRSKVYLDFVNEYNESFVDIDINDIKDSAKEQLALIPSESTEIRHVDKTETRVKEGIAKYTKIQIHPETSMSSIQNSKDKIGMGEEVPIRSENDKERTDKNGRNNSEEIEK